MLNDAAAADCGMGRGLCRQPRAGYKYWPGTGIWRSCSVSWCRLRSILDLDSFGSRLPSCFRILHFLGSTVDAVHAPVAGAVGYYFTHVRVKVDLGILRLILRAPHILQSRSVPVRLRSTGNSGVLGDDIEKFVLPRKRRLRSTAGRRLLKMLAYSAVCLVRRSHLE